MITNNNLRDIPWGQKDMLSHVSWAHKIDVGGGDGHMRWPVNIYIYLKKDGKKNIPKAQTAHQNVSFGPLK